MLKKYRLFFGYQNHQDSVYTCSQICEMSINLENDRNSITRVGLPHPDTLNWTIRIQQTKGERRKKRITGKRESGFSHSWLPTLDCVSPTYVCHYWLLLWTLEGLSTHCEMHNLEKKHSMIHR